MTEGIVLYHYWRSSCSWRVRWALNHKQIPHRLVTIDLLKQENRSPEFLKLNPLGFLPVMITEGQAFTESLAILEYLEESYPQAPLYPNDPPSRMLVRQLALQVIAGIQPLQNLSVLNYYAPTDANKRKEIAAHFIEKGLRSFETVLEKRECAGSYCLGSLLSLADLALIPQCYNALRNDVKLEDFPLIHRIYQNCLNLDACKKAAPENHKP